MRPLVVVLGGAAFLCACGAQSAPRTVTSQGQPSLDPRVTHRLGSRRFVAGCEEPRVTGGLDSDYRRESLVVGPLAIYPARSEFPRMPREDFVPVTPPSRYAAIEAAVTVTPGARVTVSVPAEERRRVGLLFDPARWDDANRGYTMREGDAEVTFPGCFRPYTQYSGGFVVSRPHCAHLIVTAEGARPIRAAVLFGTRTCNR